jgi:hypothetical protein
MSRSRVSPRSLVAAAVVLAGFASAACEITVDAGPYIAREEKRFQVSGTPNLTLDTFDGSMEVRSWDRDEVLVVVERRGSDKAQAEAIQVRAEQAGATITVTVRRPDGRQQFGFRLSPSARLVASVPRHCNLVARSGDGSIRAERIAGRIELRTGDGGIRGVALAGSLVVHTGDGSLRFDDVDGTVDLESGDGGARLSGRLQGVRLRTGDGSVTVRATEGSVMNGDWEIRTGDGGLHLELPPAFSAALDASTGDGSVRLQGFGGQDAPASSREHRNTVQRPLNAGGQTLRLRSDSGTITIKAL